MRQRSGRAVCALRFHPARVGVGLPPGLGSPNSLVFGEQQSLTSSSILTFIFGMDFHRLVLRRGRTRGASRVEAWACDEARLV